MLKKVCSVLSISVVLASLWGCSSAPSSSQSSSAVSSSAPESAAVESSSSESSSNAAQTEYPITVTDAAGRSVTIEQEPETLVSGYYITSSMLIALGQQDKLVGIEAKADTRPIYSLAAPELLELPSVGTAKEFDLEGCAALKPDLVILPLKLKNSAADLEELGISSLVVSPENKEELVETLSLLGQVTNSQEKTDEILDFIEEKQEFLSNTIQPETKTNVYLAGNSSFLNTAGTQMYQNTLIELAGGQNVAAELEDTYWAEISYEQLLAWNPDAIVIAPEADYTKQDILSDAQLASLNAVQNNRIYQMPSSTEAWDSPVPSSILGSLWIASVLYPESYSADQFLADANEFYQTFYGFEVTAEMMKAE